MKVGKRRCRSQKRFFWGYFLLLGNIPRLVMIDGQDNQLVTER